MQTHPECLPCFMKQASLAAQRVSDDPRTIFRTVQHAAAIALPLARMSQPPGVNATHVFRAATDFLGIPDPYAAEKERYNALALERYDSLRAYIQGAPDPLLAAVKVAALGNVLDLNIVEAVDMGALVAEARAVTWGIDHYAHFQRDVSLAKRILVLGDNAGEIVFDRLLVEALPPGTATYAVKSGPIANDVLMADAVQVQMHTAAPVIETGSSYFGTPLAHCSPAFRAAFDAADVIIAKGMANFETLSDVNANLYFILKVKCPVVAAHTGAQTGDLLLLAQRVLLGMRQEA